MPAARNVSESAAEGPLPLRRRQDVSVHPQELGASGGWVLKDPVAVRTSNCARRSWRSGRCWTDGPAWPESSTTLCRTLRAPARAAADPGVRQPPVPVGPGGLRLAGTRPPVVGVHLRARRRRGWWHFLANLLAIRVAAFDPEPWLPRLAAQCRWLFSGSVSRRLRRS